MGRNDKHKAGKSRNNVVFKVVSGKAGKGKAKPVETKIKHIANIKKRKVLAVESLDAQLVDLQRKAVSLSGIKEKSERKVEPLKNSLSTSTTTSSVEVDTISEELEKTLKKT